MALFQKDWLINCFVGENWMNPVSAGMVINLKHSRWYIKFFAVFFKYNNCATRQKLSVYLNEHQMVRNVLWLNMKWIPWYICWYYNFGPHQSRTTCIIWNNLHIVIRFIFTHTRAHTHTHTHTHATFHLMYTHKKNDTILFWANCSIHTACLTERMSFLSTRSPTLGKEAPNLHKSMSWFH